MTTADGDELEENLELNSLTFDSNKIRCTNESSSGKLSISFKMDEKSKVKSINLAMKILPADYKDFWEISQANLTITRADIDRKRTFSLTFPDIYASPDRSYSCSGLEFRTMKKRKTDNETKSDAKAKLTLYRFQLQPFPERELYVFAPSYDCSTWMTIPGLMGFTLILFITVVTVLGTICLKRIETNDFKYTKEGLLFTHSQLEASKRAQ